MFINNAIKLNPIVSFNGVYKKTGSTVKVSGKSYFNKKVLKVNNYTYHPFPNEKLEDINKLINNKNKAYKFYLIEKEHFHTEGIYYCVQKVSLGDTVSKSDIENDKAVNEQDFLSKDFIHNLYNNAAYGVMDLQELKPENIVD